MSKEKQRELEEINRPMNEEAFNNLEKKYQELAKVKAESEQIEEMALIICGFKDCTSCISRMGLRKCGAKAYAERFYNAGYRKMPENMGEFSDGFHTFNELYHHRAVLFSVICNMFPEKAWKSKLHDTGDMYDGMFIVGIETEQGQATYHYDIEPYWDMFKVKELEKAPKYDGHTPSDAIERIGKLKQSEGEWVVAKTERAWNCAEYAYMHRCSVCGNEEPSQSLTPFCPHCGAKMKGEKQ